MAEVNENKVEENKIPDENLTAPVAAEITDTGGNSTPEAPGVADGGDVVVPSNVIDGIFAEKRAIAMEAEKKAVEMDNAAPETPSDDNLKKEQEALLKSLDSKADDFAKRNPAPKKKDTPVKANTGKSPKTEKSAKAEKPPKTPRGKQAASVGGGGIGGTGGKSAQTTVEREVQKGIYP